MLLSASSNRTTEVGDFLVEVGDDGTLTLTHTQLGTELSGVRLHGGTGSAEVEFQYGMFRFTDETETLSRSGQMKLTRIGFVEVSDDRGDRLGILQLSAPGPDAVLLQWTPDGANRAGLSAPCEQDDHFLGLPGFRLTPSTPRC